MERSAFIKYGFAVVLLSMFILPFCVGGWKVSGQGSNGAVNDTVYGRIDGRNPGLREPRPNDPQLEARFVPDSIAIGDTVRLELDITRDIMQIVELAEFENSEKGMIGDIFEIVGESGPDTVGLQGRKVTLRKTYTLQTFEDGIMSLGWVPALYIDKNIVDTIWSLDSLVLTVGTFEIDTLNQTIHDIRNIMPAPVKFGEFGGYVLWGLLIVAVAAAGIWYFITRRRNLTMLGKPKVVDPPHVAAIKALETLHNQKLWQNNRHKQYYTGITDILRTYLETRYIIAAKEMTSDEILQGLKEREIPEKSYGDLTAILRTADLVKFAKFVPDPETNENIYTQAYYFVEETKPFEIETPMAAEPTGL